jgi:hypothetical protein
LNTKKSGRVRVPSQVCSVCTAEQRHHDQHPRRTFPLPRRAPLRLGRETISVPPSSRKLDPTKALGESMNGFTMDLRRRSKVAAIVCVIVAVVILFILPVFPYQYVGSCRIISQGGVSRTQCGPDHASLSFEYLGNGYMLTHDGSAAYYSWCTNLGGGGFICPGGWLSFSW